MKVSVIMPAFNAENHIKEAIDSILSQSFSNFEFIIIDDGSIDSTNQIVKEYAKNDKRIKLIKNTDIKGVTGALNTGLKAAIGEYIVRMDADDIALPQRLQRQVDFMDKNPEFGLAGSWYEMFGDLQGTRELSVDTNLIQVTMLFHGALAHPTTIFRRELFSGHDLHYDTQFKYGQDYDLWVRASKVTKITNIPEVLLKYRIHKKNVGTQHSYEQTKSAKAVRRAQILGLGIYPTFEEVEFHEAIANWAYSKDKYFAERSLMWFEKLIAFNNLKKIFDEETFVKYLYTKWLDIYAQIEEKSVETDLLQSYVKEFLSKGYKDAYPEHVKFLASKLRYTETFFNPAAPKISVVMAAYNSEKYIRDSIESILNQTYKDFEFLIVNDASTDSTEEIIKEYQSKDERIKLLQNVNGKGISGAANTGLDNAKGEYIARMDSDDVSLPERFHEEVAFMDANPDIGACGAWVRVVGLDGYVVWENPVDPDYIKSIMLFYGAISNPVAMLRRSVLEDNNFRYENTAAEDYELYVRISRVAKLANIPKVLLNYRLHSSNFGKVNRQIQNESANYIRLKQLTELGIEPTQDEKLIHCQVGFWEFSDDKSFLIESDIWFRKLIEANSLKKVFPEPMFSTVMVEKWFDIYKSTNYLGTTIVLNFLANLMYKTASKRYRIKMLKHLTRAYLSKLKHKIKKRL